MASSRILVLGATGGTGRQVVSQALQMGHEVTVFVRSPERLRMRSEGLRVVVGNVIEDIDALDAAVRSQDAVISALGVGNSLKANGLIAQSIPAIVRAMKSEGVRRLIFTSAFGAGETMRDLPLVPRLMIRYVLKDLYSDKNIGEAELHRTAHDLDWTLVYPVTLTNGPGTGRYRAGERLRLRGVPRISRADVAAFLLSQVEDATYVRRGVLVSS
ncbi:MAG TPA: NAD(P)H-binding protein [Gemmatimonadaceae bacterium]